MSFNADADRIMASSYFREIDNDDTLPDLIDRSVINRDTGRQKVAASGTGAGKSGGVRIKPRNEAKVRVACGIAIGLTVFLTIMGVYWYLNKKGKNDIDDDVIIHDTKHKNLNAENVVIERHEIKKSKSLLDLDLAKK